MQEREGEKGEAVSGKRESERERARKEGEREEQEQEEDGNGVMFCFIRRSFRRAHFVLALLAETPNRTHPGALAVLPGFARCKQTGHSTTYPQSGDRAEQ